MTFNSIEFFIFFIIVFILFSLTVDKYRWFILLLASYFFYATFLKPYLILILLIVTIITYIFGLWINKIQANKKKKLIFITGVSVNLFILIYLKYLSFIFMKITSLLNFVHFNVILPEIPLLSSIGISYYIFQAISYLIDIYLETEKPEKHFGHFALYLSFFPKLLQGPIERAGTFIPQLKSNYNINYDNLRMGLIIFYWGLFKKMAIADRLAIYVNPVYNDVHSFTGPQLIIATYFYAIQLYCDFSGYTDMAIGIARIFNINLTENFNNPYFATSIADFWRRWHISFSGWLLDYIFKPLQMTFRNFKDYGNAIALIITFLVCGIWHGAGWTFIIWGLLHGTYMALSVLTKKLQKYFYKKSGLEKAKITLYIQIFLTFNLVCIGWIFFRAENIRDAIYVITHLFSTMTLENLTLNLDGISFGIIIFYIILLFILEKISFIQAIVSYKIHWILRGIFYTFILYSLFLGGVKSENFLYFRF